MNDVLAYAVLFGGTGLALGAYLGARWVTRHDGKTCELCGKREAFTCPRCSVVLRDALGPEVQS